jgi:hypothetical protein
MVADTHFARSGLTDGYLHQMHLLGATVLVNLDGTGQR